MIEVTIAVLLFGLGVFALGFWASRRLPAAKLTRPGIAQSKSEEISHTASHGYGRSR
jgi:hypothetical protein